MQTPHSLLLVGGLGFTVAAAAIAAAQTPTPPPLSNLQVLDKSVTRREVVDVMKGFTRSLGVRCQHCHIYKGNDPDDLTAFDFPSDEKVEKRTARAMVRMTSAINLDLLKGVGEVSAEAKVTCYTCHRGERRPLTQKPQP